MSFFNKLKWILGVIIVFVLVITTNLIDRNNFIRIRDSIVTIYEDRLMAKDLIFKMASLVDDKELAVAKKDTSFFKEDNSRVNEEFEKLILRFQETRLTVQEEKTFNTMKSQFASIQTIEASGDRLLGTETSSYQSSIDELNDLLQELATIQVDEGRKQMNLSKRAMASVELFTQIEIYFLIALAIIIQIIIIYSPWSSKKSE